MISGSRNVVDVTCDDDPPGGVGLNSQSSRPTPVRQAKNKDKQWVAVVDLSAVSAAIEIMWRKICAVLAIRYHFERCALPKPWFKCSTRMNFSAGNARADIVYIF